MKSSRVDEKDREIRVELKYCEHCGGLWLRECGSGVAYCENCRPVVADLPVPKKKPGRVGLPVRPHTAVEQYPCDDDGMDGYDVDDFEAAGGAA
ncbi:MAG TPA: hypothetical protein VMH04_19245 [Candidatus Solibacter sp.]|nr:hypothetical protein [Candidatus Solibacter sp.]